jgi:hypothetical protein
MLETVIEATVAPWWVLAALVVASRDSLWVRQWARAMHVNQVHALRHGPRGRVVRGVRDGRQAPTSPHCGSHTVRGTALDGGDVDPNTARPFS